MPVRVSFARRVRKHSDNAGYGFVPGLTTPMVACAPPMAPVHTSMSKATMIASVWSGGYTFIRSAVTALFALFALARGLTVRAPLFKRRRPFLVLPAIFAHDLAHASQERPR